MYQVSSAFREAVYARNAVIRPLVRFLDSPVIFTAEDLQAGGLEAAEYLNPDDDLTVGAAPSAELQMHILNRAGLLDNFSYGECRVLLGVRTDSAAWTRGKDSVCTAVLGYGTAARVRLDGCDTEPYLKVNGSASPAQPESAVYAIVADGSTVYCVLESGDVWTAIWTGSALEHLDDYTWADLARYTWAQTAVRKWAEYAPATDLSEFMRRKLQGWTGRGLWYADDLCYEFTDTAVERYEYVPLGVFTADTPSKRRTLTVAVTANDRMVRFDADATDWWRSLSYPITLQDLLRKLCLRVGVPLATTGTFVNSGRTLASAPIAASALTYRDVLKWIAEAACSYARMTRNGALELVWFQDAALSLSSGQYFPDTDRAEFTVPQVTGVQVLCAENDVGVLVGSKGNVYQIMDNPMLYGQEETVRALAEPIRSRLAAFGTYQPMTVRALGNWAVQAGDIIRVDGVPLPVFRHTITYKGGVSSEYQSTGSATRPQPTTERRETYRQAAALHQLEVTVQGIQSHIADQDGNMTDLKLFAEGLSIKVTNNADNTGASMDLRSGKIALSSTQISFRGLVPFESLKTAGQTVINGANITTGFMSADRIRGGTIDADEINVTNLNADSITAGAFSGDRIEANAITASKIATDAIVNRHLTSGSVYPSTCNSTINGYFADVIYATKIVTGQMQADNLWTKKMYAAVSEISALTVAGNTFMIDGENYRTMKKDLATYVIGR